MRYGGPEMWAYARAKTDAGWRAFAAWRSVVVVRRIVVVS
jgi:hypothetical protein